MNKPLIIAAIIWVVLLYYRDSVERRAKSTDTPQQAADPVSVPMSGVMAAEAVVNPKGPVTSQPQVNVKAPPSEEEDEFASVAGGHRKAQENFLDPDLVMPRVIAQLAGYFQVAMIAVMFLGGKFFQYMGQAEPEWYKNLQENRMMAFAGTMVVNSIANSLTATGAFEVILNDQVVFSKLQMNRMPSAQEIISRLTELGMEPYKG